MKFKVFDTVSFVRLFLGSKGTKVRWLAIDVDAAGPCSVARKTDALKSVFVAPSSVGVILSSRSLSKICDPIIGLDPIVVVDPLWKPFAVHVKPCQHMCFSRLPINRDQYVSAVRDGASDLSNDDPRSRHLPSEDASVWIVIQQRSNDFLCEFRFDSFERVVTTTDTPAEYGSTVRAMSAIRSDLNHLPATKTPDIHDRT